MGKRVLLDPPDGVRHFVEEVESQALRLLLVVCRCCLHLLLGRLYEDDRSHLSSRLAFSITSAAGLASILPARYS